MMICILPWSTWKLIFGGSLNKTYLNRSVNCIYSFCGHKRSLSIKLQSNIIWADSCDFRNFEHLSMSLQFDGCLFRIRNDDNWCNDYFVVPMRANTILRSHMIDYDALNWNYIYRNSIQQTIVSFSFLLGRHSD